MKRQFYIEASSMLKSFPLSQWLLCDLLWKKSKPFWYKKINFIIM